MVAIGHRAAMHLCGSDDLDAVEGLRMLARVLYESGDAAPVSTEPGARLGRRPQAERGTVPIVGVERTPLPPRVGREARG